MGCGQGVSSAGSNRNAVGYDLHRDTKSKRGTVGSFANQYLKYVQAIRAMRVAVAGERHGVSRGWQINNFGQPWKKFNGKQGVGGDGKGEPRSRNQGKVEKYGR